MEDRVDAAAHYRDSMIEKADKIDGNFPMWYGWALFDSFLAGVQWQKELEIKKRSEKPIIEIEQMDGGNLCVKYIFKSKT